ncbi:MAG: hypothetical protein EOO73_07615 [Myxococcales bacterium]|nr:MAG: hypothetical protein EOO73_07615 [Myxococcales bacterium]
MRSVFPQCAPAFDDSAPSSDENSRSHTSLTPPCSLMLKLFEGQRGPMHLGRLTKGEDAGRFVLLRDLTAHEVQAMASEIDLARSIAHPKLLKLLGCVRSEGHTYLASEYVPGVALTEVRSALRKQRTTLPAPVAVRIALDALKASVTARELLGSATGIAASSVFHPDAIWLAEFGETLLIPAPVPPAPAGRTPYSSAAADTAPGLIMELATGLSPARLLGQGMRDHLPEALADALSQALARHVSAGDDTEAVLVHSLSQLPAELIASEQDVESELLRLVGPRLESRRLLCAVDQDNEGEPGADDATVISRLAKVDRPFDADEPTRAVGMTRVAREADPDGPTRMMSSRPPAPRSVPPEPPWAAALLERTQPSAAPAVKSSAAPAQVSPQGRVALVMLWLLALVATVTMIAWVLGR